MSYSVSYTSKLVFDKEISRNHEREFKKNGFVRGGYESPWELVFSVEDDKCYLRHNGCNGLNDIEQLVAVCNWLDEKGYNVSGTMTLVGEDPSGDTGVIIVKHNKVSTIDTSPTKFIELMEKTQALLWKVNMPVGMELQDVLNSFIEHHNK